MTLTSLTVESDVGSGRTIICAYDLERHKELASTLAATLSASHRVIVIRAPEVTPETWRSLSSELPELLSKLSIRQASFVSFSGTATLVQNLVLNQPKLVRTLVLVDSTARPHPSLMNRAIDAIETMLPFGLPLRLGSSGFNVRAYLHRVRCPVLVITTPFSSDFERREGAAIALQAPTAWLLDLHSCMNFNGEFASQVNRFQDTPAKCPQKNLAHKNASSPSFEQQSSISVQGGTRA